MLLLLLTTQTTGRGQRQPHSNGLIPEATTHTYALDVTSIRPTAAIRKTSAAIGCRADGAGARTKKTSNAAHTHTCNATRRNDLHVCETLQIWTCCRLCDHVHTPPNRAQKTTHSNLGSGQTPIRVIPSLIIPLIVFWNPYANKNCLLPSRAPPTPLPSPTRPLPS